MPGSLWFSGVWPKQGALKSRRGKKNQVISALNFQLGLIYIDLFGYKKLQKWNAHGETLIRQTLGVVSLSSEVIVTPNIQPGQGQGVIAPSISSSLT